MTGRRRRYPGFTRQQHDRVGEELKRIREDLFNVLSCIAPAYGLALHDKGQLVVKHLDRLRSLLDDALSREAHARARTTDDGDDFDTHVYYGPRRQLTSTKPPTTTESAPSIPPFNGPRGLA